jgi:hypothetical protein
MVSLLLLAHYFYKRLFCAWGVTTLAGVTTCTLYSTGAGITEFHVVSGVSSVVSIPAIGGVPCVPAIVGVMLTLKTKRTEMTDVFCRTDNFFLLSDN